jgi:O-acetylhomoserine (thiol)-lyase
VIVDSGKFPWTDHKEKFHMLNTPEPSYHGVVYTEAFEAAAYIGRCRTVALRNTGSCLSAQSAFQILQGLETLGLRMERHCENALIVAKYLEGHDKVEWVSFAGLESSPFHDLAKKYCDGKPASLLTFGIKGGYDAAVKFYDALAMFKRLVNIGDAKSLACHPASTTHRQLTEGELATAGVTNEMIRLCVGIEDIEDIKADLEQALNA